jgi:hypothetical protein
MAEMSALRRRMIEDTTIRNLSPATQRSYLHAVSSSADISASRLVGSGWRTSAPIGSTYRRKGWPGDRCVRCASFTARRLASRRSPSGSPMPHRRGR